MKLKKQDLECIHPAKDKLAKNFRYHITINELAKELGLNRTKLQYAFKNLYGLSIAEFRVQLRMEKAKELLEQTDKSIKEIARFTGYKNISSFSVAFKKTYKQSPSKWRNQEVSCSLATLGAVTSFSI
jgi:AraC-like DNA-binding protein